jgi:hypothetical protein
MAITSWACAHSASPHGDQDLVGGDQLHRSKAVDDEFDRHLGGVHRCSTPAVNSPHAAQNRGDIVETTTGTSTVPPGPSTVGSPR